MATQPTLRSLQQLSMVYIIFEKYFTLMLIRKHILSLDDPKFESGKEALTKIFGDISISRPPFEIENSHVSFIVRINDIKLKLGTKIKCILCL